LAVSLEKKGTEAQGPVPENGLPEFSIDTAHGGIASDGEGIQSIC
jgi:hypothetical protein